MGISQTGKGRFSKRLPPNEKQLDVSLGVEQFVQRFPDTREPGYPWPRLQSVATTPSKT